MSNKQTVQFILKIFLDEKDILTINSRGKIMKVHSFFISITLFYIIGQSVSAQSSIIDNQQFLSNQKWKHYKKSSQVLLKNTNSNVMNYGAYPSMKSTRSIYSNTYSFSGLSKKSTNNLADTVWKKMNGPYGGDVRKYCTYFNKLYAITNREIYVYQDLQWHPLNFSTICTWMIYSMYILDSGKILVASDDGLFYSDNNGDKWNKIDIGDPYIHTYDIYAIDCGNFLISTSKGIYVYKDGSKNYSPFSLNNINVRTINFDKNGNIWAGTDSVIYKADYKLLNWQKMDVEESYYEKIIIDSNNVVYAYSETKVYKSTDSGKNWFTLEGYYITNISLGENQNLIITSYHLILTANNEGIQFVSQRSDDFFITIYYWAEEKEILVGALGTGAMKYDIQQDKLIYFSDGMNSSTIGDIVPMANGEIILNSWADSFYVSKDNGLTWKSTYHAWSRCMKSGNDGSVYAGADCGLIKSVDFGKTWKPLNLDVTPYFINSFDISNDNKVICAGSSTGEVYVSYDGGENFKLIRNSDYNFVDAIKIINDTTFLINCGVLYYTNDAGKTLTAINDTLIYQVNDFVVDDLGYIYLASNSGIFRSKDGIHWKNTSANTGGAFFLRIDKYNNLYAASDQGLIKYSTNRGKSWEEYPEWLSCVDTYSFAFIPDGYLLLGSESLGLFRRKIKISELEAPDDPEIEEPEIEHLSLLQNFPNPFNSTTKIEYTLPYNAFAEIKIYDVLGREVETITSGYKSKGIYIAVWNAAKYSSGIYLYKLKIGNEIKVKKMVLLK